MHNKVATNLRTLLKAKGISENKLAHATGVPQPTIHRVVSGIVANPRESTLAPLARFFNVTVESLRHAEDIGTDKLRHWKLELHEDGLWVTNLQTKSSIFITANP